jgi:hypothetical protein
MQREHQKFIQELNWILNYFAGLSTLLLLANQIMFTYLSELQTLEVLFLKNED